MTQEERKKLVSELIDLAHKIKNNCNDIINCRKCQVVELLRKDIGLE
jgi:hypothetical protein